MTQSVRSSWDECDRSHQSDYLFILLCLKWGRDEDISGRSIWLSLSSSGRVPASLYKPYFICGSTGMLLIWDLEASPTRPGEKGRFSSWILILWTFAVRITASKITKPKIEDLWTYWRQLKISEVPRRENTYTPRKIRAKPIRLFHLFRNSQLRGVYQDSRLSCCWLIL